MEYVEYRSEQMLPRFGTRKQNTRHKCWPANLHKQKVGRKVDSPVEGDQNMLPQYMPLWHEDDLG